MKARLVLFTTWINSNPQTVKVLAMTTAMTLAIFGLMDGGSIVNGPAGGEVG